MLRDEVVADRVLSLLRERFEDEGEAGMASGAAAMSVLVWRPLLSLAFRRRARSLCSLKSFLSAPGEAAAEGRGGTTKLEDGIVAVVGAEHDGMCDGLQVLEMIGQGRQRCVWALFTIARLAGRMGRACDFIFSNRDSLATVKTA